jgi:ABC-2 type transport system ATP-binding protein
LRFDSDRDMRSEVFDFAGRNGLKTLQINQKIADLEGLFHELTR